MVPQPAHFTQKASQTSQGRINPGLGVFVTESTYNGHNGFSLRLKGLERGFNTNAYSRSIVMHGAWYVNEGLKSGIGRSSGAALLSQLD